MLNELTGKTVTVTTEQTVTVGELEHVGGEYFVGNIHGGVRFTEKDVWEVDGNKIRLNKRYERVLDRHVGNYVFYKDKNVYIYGVLQKDEYGNYRVFGGHSIAKFSEKDVVVQARESSIEISPFIPGNVV